MTGTNQKRRAASAKVTDMPLNMRKTPHGYQYRRVVPEDVRAQIGKREFKKSLGKDFLKAKSLLAALEVESNAAIDRARVAAENGRSIESYLKRSPDARLKSISGSSPDLAGKLSALYLAGLDVDLENRRKQVMDDDDFQALEENVADMVPRINRALATGNVTAFFPVIQTLLLGRGYVLDATQEEMQLLTYGVLEHIQAGYKSLAGRQHGEMISPDQSSLPAPLDAAWEKPSEPSETNKAKKATETNFKLSDVVPIFEKHLASINRKTQTTNLSIWKRLTEFCGDKPLAAMQSNDIYNFLEARLDDKVKPWSQKYTGRAKNVLREAFGLAQTKNMTTRNPVSEMTVSPRISANEDELRQKPRYPYSMDQLNEILESDWYNPDATRWRGKLREDLGARYWVPLICLFHGLRIREALQLHTHDLTLSSIPLVTIQVEVETEDNAPKRNLKNDATKRQIPIHPILVSLGFMEFVEDAKKRKIDGPLFPSSLPKPGGVAPMWGRSYEQGYLRYVRDTLGFGSGFGNHSYRHTTEDRIRDIQLDRMWPPGLSQFYTGRTLPRDADKWLLRLQGSESDYGKGYIPERILPYVAKIQFPDLRLPPPFKQWLDNRAAVSPKLLKTLEIYAKYSSRLGVGN